MPNVNNAPSPSPFNMTADVDSFAVRADGVPRSIARASGPTTPPAVAPPAQQTPPAPSRPTTAAKDGVAAEASWLDEALDRAHTARKTVSYATKAVKFNATTAASRNLTLAHTLAQGVARPGLTRDATRAALDIASRTEGLMKETSRVLKVADKVSTAAYWAGAVSSASKIASDVVANDGPTRASVMPGLDLAVGAAGKAAPNPLVKSFSVGWSIGRGADSALGLSDRASDLAMAATDQRVHTDIRGTLQNAEDTLGSDDAMDGLIHRLATGKASNSDRGSVTNLLNEARLAGVLRQDGSIDEARARDLAGWWSDGDLVDAIARAQIAEKFL